MKKLLVIMLLTAVALSGWFKYDSTKRPGELKKDGISLLLFGDESQAFVAIRVEAERGADLAIVRILYETYFDEIPIVLSKESVVPAIAGIHVLADSAPADLEKVRSVRITLVREISKTEFKW